MVLRDGLGDAYLRLGSSLFRVGSDGRPTRLSLPVLSDDVPCASRSGGVWAREGRRTFIRVGSAAPRRLNLGDGTGSELVGGCAEDVAGSLWVLQAGPDTLSYVTETGHAAARLGDEAQRIPNELVADPHGGVVAYVGRGSLWHADGSGAERLWAKQDVSIEFLEFLYQGPRYLLAGGPAGLARLIGRRVQVLPSSRFPYLAHLSGAVQTAAGETWLQNSTGVVRLSTADLDRAFDDPHAPLSGRTFDADDGLPGTGPYFSLSTLTEDRQGRIWAATSNGFGWVDPRRLPHNSVPPPVVISGIRSGLRRFRMDEELVLPERSSRIEVDYEGLSFIAPKRIRFRYRLSGVDPEWIEAGNQRQAAYTNLAPGRYRFQVIAANDDGVWNASGASLAFVIRPTFVQSGWFLALCCLGAGVLLWSAYAVRLRQVTSRMRLRQKERLAERERIARDLHDTLLQGFQGLVLQFQSVANAMPDHENAKVLMDQALDSADEVLSDGRESVMQLRSASSDDLPDMLAETAARMRAADPTEFQMVVEGSRRALNPIVREELRRIGDEALSNAFRHARANLIELVISYHSAALLIGVRDDGDGIDPTVFKEGGRQGHFGLVGMRERAAEIDAEIDIASRPEIGTEILVRVPGRLAYATRLRMDWRTTLKRFLGLGGPRP
jgi:signal transduction histidine kinase